MNRTPASRLFLRRPVPCCLYNTTRPSSRRILSIKCARNASSNRFFSEDEKIPGFEKPPRNPLDPITMERYELARRAYYKRRFNYALAGTIISMLIPLLVVLNLDIEQMSKNSKDRTDSSNSETERFHGKPVVIAPGGEKLLAHDEKSGEEVELIPTGTSSIPHFPKTIRLLGAGEQPGNEQDTEYTLLGLGIRTVSFLSIQVYVVGIYVQTSSLASLQSLLVHHVNPLASALIPGEKESLRAALLDPERSYNIWDKVWRNADSGIKAAIRIVPVRNTDFHHLCDGFVRGITQRTQDAMQRGDDEFNDESFAKSMREFKALFRAKGKAPKGSAVFLARSGSGALSVKFQLEEGRTKVRDFGAVADERIGRLVWLGYLGGKTVSSEGARKSVVDGIMGLVERPAGTIDAMVE